jgi:hypothetical protein
VWNRLCDTKPVRPRPSSLGAGDRGEALIDNRQPGAWLLESVARGGVDVEELTERLPEEIHRMTSSPETLEPEVVNTILLECALPSGDSNFGLRMIELVQTSDLGVYGDLLS